MESSEFWNFYWEVRLAQFENQGKREAILVTSRLIRQQAQALGRPLRLLELGCGEGQIIGTLVEGHAQLCAVSTCVGIDYLHSSILTCRKDFPSMQFIEGDFTDEALLNSLGQFDIIILVNALHEVFSDTYSEQLGQVNVPDAKARVEQALAGATGRALPGGFVVLFDGLEPPGDPEQKVRLRFLHPQALEHFETFAREYHPFHIDYRALGSPFLVELSRHDFTRYITKSIFLGKRLWQHERFESYQYFNENEFRAAFARAGLTIQELRTLTMNEEKWRRNVEIASPGVRFPEEHILIIAQAGRPAR
jgi:SAM-dependent methyltransferase